MNELDLDTKYVLAMIIDIKKDINENILSEKELTEKHKEFISKYPTLYKMVKKENDLSELFKMLQMIEKIKNKQITKKDADAVIGTSVAHKFVPKEILENKRNKENKDNKDSNEGSNEGSNKDSNEESNEDNKNSNEESEDVTNNEESVQVIDKS